MEKGPLADRRCTDIFCFIIFAGFVTAAVFVGLYAVQNGDPARVMTPYDNAGNFCGRSVGFEKYPYLWF